MKKPENFNKIDNEQIMIGHTQLTIDVCSAGFFVFQTNSVNGWNNAVLLMMSSGNFDGIDYDQLGEEICATL